MDNICSICFETNSAEASCTMHCGHTFHMECLQEWMDQSSERTTENLKSTVISPCMCPYCRQIILIKQIPRGLDCFYKFYYYTKFVRQKCSRDGCTLLEFPLNDGVCSRHQHPIIDKQDLKIIMDEIFCFYFLPLFSRKQLIIFAMLCFDSGVDFVDEFADLKKRLIDLLTNPKTRLGDIDIVQSNIVDTIHGFYHSRGVAVPRPFYI